MKTERIFLVIDRPHDFNEILVFIYFVFNSQENETFIFQFSYLFHGSKTF